MEGVKSDDGCAGDPRQGAAAMVRPQPRHTRPPHQKDTKFLNTVCIQRADENARQ
jgi:hypothetical protein